MKQKLDNFLNLLAHSSLTWQELISKAENISQISDFINIRDLYEWQSLGLEITKDSNGRYELATRKRNINEQIFCVVDIETTGSIKNGQIIEVGAVRIKNGQILDTFESFAFAQTVPQEITELTGISSKDLINAPTLANVMEKFKIYLNSAVFVAHNVNFDFNFISLTLANLGYPELLNRKICTIDLARRSMPSTRYGLETLKQILDIQSTHHRALSDAMAAAKILMHCINILPFSIQSVEDLIDFSKKAPMIRQKIKEPHLPVQ